MRESVKARKPAYSMDAHRAAQLLNVSHERILILAKDGVIRSTYKRGNLWVSAADVANMIAHDERQKKATRCPLRAIGAK